MKVHGIGGGKNGASSEMLSLVSSGETLTFMGI